MIPDVTPGCLRCCRGRFLGAARSGVRGVGFTGQFPPMSDAFTRPAGVQGHSGVIGRSNDLTLKTDAETITRSFQPAGSLHIKSKPLSEADLAGFRCLRSLN